MNNGSRKFPRLSLPGSSFLLLFLCCHNSLYQSSLSLSSSKVVSVQNSSSKENAVSKLTTLGHLFLSLLQRSSQGISHAAAAARSPRCCTRRGTTRICTTDLSAATIANLRTIDLLESTDTSSLLNACQYSRTTRVPSRNGDSGGRWRRRWRGTASWWHGRRRRRTTVGHRWKWWRRRCAACRQWRRRRRRRRTAIGCWWKWWRRRCAARRQWRRSRGMVVESRRRRHRSGARGR